MKHTRALAIVFLASAAACLGAAYVTDFESPPFFSGPINSQDGWTTPSAVESTARIQTDFEISSYLTNAGITPGVPVHSGVQALLVSGAGASSATIRAISDLELEQVVRLEVWARPLNNGTSGAAMGNIFLTMEDSSGERAAAFRFGFVNGIQTIDYGTEIAGIWQATGLVWNETTWYRLTLVVDYSQKTYDFLVDGVQVNASPIAFYTSLSDDFRQIRIFRGSNQAGMIIDDLSVVPEPGSGAVFLAAVSVLGLRRRRP
ncbi:MAG TPA: PEP-CTERM sorting domain-containing protein [Chthoniobacteraceae bacterium]|nr:PEP-CTERM sorting domain-containing protein [Chthoniobacteraceae bacterium]